MRQAGLDVTVACPLTRENARDDTAFVDRVEAAGVPVAVIPMRHGIHPLADLQDYAHLVRLIERDGYDVLHTHSSKAGVLGRLGARRCRVPASVYTPNAFAFLGAQNRFYRWLYRTIEQWFGQHLTDALICVSQTEMALAEQWAIAPSDRLVLVENTIAALRFAPSVDPATAKTALRLDPDRPVVGYVGRLAKQKGIEYLIQAARQVLAQRTAAQFVLVGEGELENAVRQMMARDQLDNHVLLTGYRADIPQVLTALDIFVLPSLYEGLPYTLMEAMAAGRAVIATDVMGNRDLIQVGQTGLLVPPRDADALAQAILTLLSSSEERDRLGAMAMAAARSRPTPKQMTRQVIELYTRILRQKGL
jgi:glycosyltransferase involved in cell wall biosynthesis